MKLILWRDAAPEMTEDTRKGQTDSKLPTSAKIHPHTFSAVSIRRPSVNCSWLSPWFTENHGLSWDERCFLTWARPSAQRQRWVFPVKAEYKTHRLVVKSEWHHPRWSTQHSRYNTVILNINSSIPRTKKYRDEKGCLSFEGPTLERERWQKWLIMDRKDAEDVHTGGGEGSERPPSRREETWGLTKQRWEARGFRKIVIVKSLSRFWLFVTPWTSHQASPSMGFSRQEYWSKLPFPSPGDLPYPGIEPGSPGLWADAFTIWATREAGGWMKLRGKRHREGKLKGADKKRKRGAWHSRQGLRSRCRKAALFSSALALSFHASVCGKLDAEVCIFPFAPASFSLSSVQLLSHVRFFATPWTAARQASLSITNSWSLLKLMSIESAMPPKNVCLKMGALEAWELHFKP